MLPNEVSVGVEPEAGSQTTEYALVMIVAVIMLW